MEPLYGSFEHSLDSKGRVIVPAPLRHRFEREQNAAVISYYQEKCLALWPPAEFNRRLETVMAVQDIDPEHRQMARAIAAHSSRVDIDTQWRITVPSACREWAGPSCGASAWPRAWRALPTALADFSHRPGPCRRHERRQPGAGLYAAP